MRPIKTLTVHSLINTLLLNIMSKTVALALLDRANTAAELLQILDTLVENVTEANINDFAEYAAGLKMGTLQPIEF